MVSPSATKTTISARLASEVWKRSISPLYGARASPMSEPGDEHGEKARAVRDGRDAVDHAGERERAERVERLVRERDAAASAEQQRPPRRSRSRARPTSRSRTRGRRSRTLASSCVAYSSIPIISAIPTGSLAPDSPSRIVPVRPPISRRPSTENITAGSVGASAAPRIPAVVQPKSNSQCAASAISARGRERAEHAERGDRQRPRRGSGASRPACRRRRGSRSARRRAIRSTSTVESAARARARCPRRPRRRRGRARAPGPGSARSACRRERERERAGDEEDDQAEIGELGHARYSRSPR